MVTSHHLKSEFQFQTSVMNPKINKVGIIPFFFIRNRIIKREPSFRDVSRQYGKKHVHKIDPKKVIACSSQYAYD